MSKESSRVEAVVQARAKITSKGQLTVPVEVRRKLGLGPGDVLVFEVSGGYATVHKKRPTQEAIAEIREHYPPPVSRPITNEDAIAEYFDEEYELRLGPTLYVGREDGAIEAFGERDGKVDLEGR